MCYDVLSHSLIMRHRCDYGLGSELELGRVRVRWCVVTRGYEEVLCVEGSAVEGGSLGVVSRLWLEGRMGSMLAVLLGGDLDV